MSVRLSTPHPVSIMAVLSTHLANQCRSIASHFTFVAPVSRTESNTVSSESLGEQSAPLPPPEGNVVPVTATVEELLQKASMQSDYINSLKDKTKEQVAFVREQTQLLGHQLFETQALANVIGIGKGVVRR